MIQVQQCRLNKKIGYSQQITLHRPAGAPRVEEDEQHERELQREQERNRILRERDDMIRSRETDDAFEDAAGVWGEILGTALGRRLR